MPDKEFVKSRHPDCWCTSVPMKLRRDDEMKFIVFTSAMHGLVIGSGFTQEEAWSEARRIVEAKEELNAALARPEKSV